MSPQQAKLQVIPCDLQIPSTNAPSANFTAAFDLFVVSVHACCRLDLANLIFQVSSHLIAYRSLLALARMPPRPRFSPVPASIPFLSVALFNLTKAGRCLSPFLGSPLVVALFQATHL